MQNGIQFTKLIQFINLTQTDSTAYQSLYPQHLLNQQLQQTNSLSFSQLNTLRDQILFYKNLIRNLDININQVYSPELYQSQKKKIQKNYGSSKQLDANAVKYKQKNQIVKNMLTAKLRKSQQKQQRYFIQKNQYFINKRKTQISSLLNSDTISKNIKDKLLLQFKFLSTIDPYNKLKQKILEPIYKQKRFQKFLENKLLDRHYFKREKPVKSQKINLHFKNDQQKRKRLKHRDFQEAIFNHQRQFLIAHKQKNKLIKKITKQALQRLTAIQKKHQAILQKRIGLLKKQGGYQEYINYIKTIKNDRILQFLKKTDIFLKELGAKVRLQKGQQQQQNNEQANLQNENGQFLKGNRMYYQIAHTLKQQILEQPAMLENGTLKNYQLSGLQWMVSMYNNNLNGILADQMGLGKTIETISLFCYLMQKKKNFGPFIVIVPLSTISNWVFQFDKWAPNIKKIIYKGNQVTRMELAKTLKNTKWNVCITTYDYILRDKKQLVNFHWQYIVVDQGHRMKNSKSKFTLIMKEYRSAHRLLLTGTPLQNNLGELWSLLNFLLPFIFQSCDDFEKWFYLPITKFGGNNTEHTSLQEEERLLIVNRLHQVLRPFLLRRKKKQVQSELPDKKQFVIRIQLSAWQKHIQKTIQDKCVRQFDSSTGKSSAGTVMNNLMMQFRKCCNHPYLFLTNFQNMNPDWIYRSSGKFQLLDRMLPKLIKLGHRILIFSQMTQLMNIMCAYFDYKGIQFLRLDGSTKADDRGQRMVMFNQVNSKYDVFLLSTRAGGLGLNLQAADTVIIFDSDWNPHMDIQAQDRAHRIGQKNEVRVLRLVTNTLIEQEILQKAAYKMNLDQIYIQAGMFNQKSTQSQQKQRIQNFFQKKKIFDQQQNQVPDDEQINLYLARDQVKYFNQWQFQEYQKMDKQRYESEREEYKDFADPREGKFINYRLMKHEQLPDWVVQVPKNENEQRKLQKKRFRRQVNYNSQLSQQQFIRLLDKQFEKVKGKKKKAPPLQQTSNITQ